MASDLWRRALAEFVGTALLVAAVIGSGIAAQRLSPGDIGLELLENAIATGAALVALIVALAPVSGAHLNPIVTLVDRWSGGMRGRSVTAYIGAQVSGAIAGAIAANVMFGESLVSWSTHHRASGPHLFGEVIATFGLVLIIFALARSERSVYAPVAVGTWITAAYWFTSSTSFANPAVAIGRMFSNTFAGIAPVSVPSFIVFQLIGGIAGFACISALFPRTHKAPPVAADRLDEG